MGGVLDSTRFSYAIASELNVHPSCVNALVVGAHGEAMVPLPRFSLVNGVPATELLDDQALARAIHSTVQAGATLVDYLKTGSAFYAAASSIVKMLEAVLENTDEILSTCTRLSGEYGIEGVFMGVPTRLGDTGVREIVELDLNDAELSQLVASAEAIKAQVNHLDI